MDITNKYSSSTFYYLPYSHFMKEQRNKVDNETPIIIYV